MTTKKIDIEPKWLDIFRIYCELHVDSKIISKKEFFEFFQKPMEIMDEVRQAQKAGKSRVVFEFEKDGTMNTIVE